MKVKKATVLDLESILSLNKSLFEFESQFGDTFNQDWTYSKKGRDYFEKRLLEDNGIVYLAEENGEVVGYICGYIDNYSYRTVNPIAEIENMYIKEGSRRNGTGTELLMKFQEECFNKGVNRIRVGVIFQNVNAINFYKKIGLKELELVLEKSI